MGGERWEGGRGEEGGRRRLKKGKGKMEEGDGGRRKSRKK